MAKEPLQPDTITAVGLYRGSCFGPCPVYRVALSTSGLAAYQGDEHVERIGRHLGEVEPERVRDLAGLIVRLGITELEPEYQAPGTDTSVQELVLWIGRHARRVVDSGSAPVEFWAMAALVDALAEEVAWAPFDPSDAIPAAEPIEWTFLGSGADQLTPHPDSGVAVDLDPLPRRADGKVYCCATLGWVDEATAFEHRWDTSRPYDEYLAERASAWDGIKPGE